MSFLNEKEIFANRYLLKKLIGVGGYSQVWLATDSKAGNMEVAIKIYAPEKGLDSDGIETFGKEFTLVFNLNHAHLLRPMHYDVSNGSPYLVMQYCPNGSLFRRIGEFSEKELARFMLQSASALNYLHSHDPPIIHQDIKPDNFLIDGSGNYLLADFGISSKIRRTLTKSMGSQASRGTLAYMPPEKFSVDKQIIKAGDIFSLGVTMFELLTGDLPFGDNGELTLKAGAEVPNLPGNFSPELNRLLRNCMSKEPWERPTAEQLEIS
ncbi:MAG: serine/threonine-protein kinase [Bacteroidetes bacterium]|nr:serine/threonine-protein kinase [Bacteroidota bacterium]